jgi:hypothetical protein
VDGRWRLRIDVELEVINSDEIEPLGAVLGGGFEGLLLAVLVFNVDTAVAVVGDRRHVALYFRWRLDRGFEPGAQILVMIEKAGSAVTGK